MYLLSLIHFSKYNKMEKKICQGGKIMAFSFSIRW